MITPILTIGLSGAFAPQLLSPTSRATRSKTRSKRCPASARSRSWGTPIATSASGSTADKMIATNTTVDRHHQRALAKQHVTSAGGQMDTGGRALDVRILGEATDFADPEKHRFARGKAPPDRPFGRRRAGARRLCRRHVSIARNNGVPVQGMGILKQPGSNAVAVAKSVRDGARHRVQKPLLPKGMTVGMHLRHDAVHRRLGQRNRARARPRRRPHGHRLLVLFFGIALERHECTFCHSDVALRNGGGALFRWIYAQYVHAARSVAWPSVSSSTTPSW